MGSHSSSGPAELCDRFLADLGVRVELDGRLDLGEPGEPLVALANHPSTGIETYALLPRMLEHRPDTRHVMHQAFLDFPPLAEICIPIDPDERSGGRSRTREMSLAHLEAGGCLLIYPSGRPAPRRRNGVAVDADWRSGAGHFAVSGRASAVALAVRTVASPAFYRLTRIHRALGELLAAHEQLRLRGHTITVHAGRRIRHDELSGHEPKAIVARLRRETDAMLGLGNASD